MMRIYLIESNMEEKCKIFKYLTFFYIKRVNNIDKRKIDKKVNNTSIKEDGK